MEEYRKHLDLIIATDQRPKNYADYSKYKRPENIPIEWYIPRKHNDELMGLMRYSYISGYEIDKEFVITSLDEPCLCVHLQKVDLRITLKDYNNLFAGVVDEMDKVAKWEDGWPTFKEPPKTQGTTSWH